MQLTYEYIYVYVFDIRVHVHVHVPGYIQCTCTRTFNSGVFEHLLFVYRKRESESVVKLEQIKQLAVNSGVFEHAETMQSLQFLHELGTLQHFRNNEFLKQHVVIEPQWIVDVMACVVSVNDSPVKV